MSERRVVMTLSASDPNVLDAQLLFHLHAGVDAIVVVGGDATVLEAHDRSRVRPARVADDLRQTVEELDPDWVIVEGPRSLVGAARRIDRSNSGWRHSSGHRGRHDPARPRLPAAMVTFSAL